MPRNKKPVIGDALVHVRERQKRNRDIVRTVRQPFERSHLVGDEIGVRKHHAFGQSRGAGGIDDGGELIGTQRRRAAAVGGNLRLACAGNELLVVRNVAARSLRAAAGENHVLHSSPDRGRTCASRAHCSSPATNTAFGCRMADDVLDMFGRFAEIDRHSDGAQAGDCEIGDVPFGTIGREDRHAIAGPDAKLGQRGCQSGDAPQHLRRSKCSPSGRRTRTSARADSDDDPRRPAGAAAGLDIVSPSSAPNCTAAHEPRQTLRPLRTGG